jgi:regulator of sigma E protease
MFEKKESILKHWRVTVLTIILTELLFLFVIYRTKAGNVLLVLLGFGAVILVHEFGHFVAAKFGGIKIEAFSIFMSPLLVGMRRTEEGIRFRLLPGILPKEDDGPDDRALCFTLGSKGKPSETEYRIGLVPFGGYVKMLGQHDTGPALESDDPRSFLNKPLGTRLAVLAAGVTCNIISAVIIFMIVFLVGVGQPPAIVGDVIPDSPAAKSGLKPGDEILEIDGKDADIDFSHIVVAAGLSGRDEEVPMTVRRADGSVERMNIVAVERPGGPMRDFGILPAGSMQVAGMSRAQARVLHAGTGLLPGDRVKAVNGKPVNASWEFTQALAEAFTPEVTLLVERNEDNETNEVFGRLPMLYGPTRNGEGAVCSMVPRLRIQRLLDNYDPPTDDTAVRLQNGDIILAIGDVEDPTYDEMRAVTTAHEDKGLLMQVLRQDSDGAERTLSVAVTPRRGEDSDRVAIGFMPILDMDRPVVAATIATEGGPTKLDIPRGATIAAVNGAAVEDFYDVIREIRGFAGERLMIDWRLDGETAGNAMANVQDSNGLIDVGGGPSEQIPFVLLERKFKASGPVDAVVMGCRKTVMFVTQTYVTLKCLAEGLVSPKSLMGPLGILSTSYKIVDSKPIVYYVYFLGLINAVIAVFNFLPLLPLDGGLVALSLIERIRGVAFSKRMQAAMAYTGWTLILALLLYVTFNDVLRTFFSRGS